MSTTAERIDSKVRHAIRRDRAIQDLRVDIANHFAENASVFKDARSGQIDDEENLRTALDPGFGRLVGKIRHWGMPDTAIFRTVRSAVFQGNVDPNQVSLEADIYAQAYLASLKDYRASIRSRRSR